MIAKLKKSIFRIIVMIPISIIFLVLLSYNYVFIYSSLEDEKDVLDYCSQCIDNNSTVVDSFLHMSTSDLIEASEDKSSGNSAVMNLLYAVISSEIQIVKTDLEGNSKEYIGSTKDLQNYFPEKISLEECSCQHIGKRMYSILKKDDSYYIVFLDTSGWRAEIRKTVILSLIGLLISVITLSIVGGYLSRKLTKPVEDAIIMQNRFIADASHELKTPVSVINANISVLEREYGTSKWMTYIRDAGHNMTELINQLLILSKLDYETNERRPATRTPEVFEVSEALLETILPFDSIAFEKNVSISSEHICSHDCIGSRNDFKEIVSILIDNAIHYSRSNSTIDVSIDDTSRKMIWESSNSVRVMISNSGSSIPPEDLPHIFDRFYKANQKENESYGSFGLGLSIAKSLAEKNSFDITAESNNNKTIFILKLDTAK